MDIAVCLRTYDFFKSKFFKSLPMFLSLGPEKYDNSRIIIRILLSVWKEVHLHTFLWPWSSKARIDEKIHRKNLKQEKIKTDVGFIY